MSKEDGCCSGSSFATFLTGALLGAAAALLLTDKTGKETREALAKYGADLKENLPKGVREKTDEAFDRGREYLDEKKKALNEAIESGKTAMAKEKKALAADPDEDNA
ncbi:MAG: YtxH domain-containing protein [Desulfobulbales bacterium]|nr:YtxH domain-containing protein [Desulfobulbales bacterium]